MAIDLSEGEYALQQNTSNTQLIHLKLTDSALRAVELYQTGQGDRAGKPTILFDGNQGVIRIPTDNGSEPQTFTFQLSKLNQSATIDGVQQYYTGEYKGRIAMMGEMQHKITVNANDESYNATRKRMTLVKEQEQKTSTKEIKQPSSSKLGKKKLVNRRIRDQHLNNVRTSTPPPGRASGSHSFARSASPLTTSSNRSVSPVTGGAPEAGIRNKTKPILSSFSTSSQSSNPQSGGKPLSERVIHYLALRPLKHQELMIRLSRDSGQPDQAKVRQVLQQVATSRTVGMGVQEFVLNKQCFAEVHADWADYTEEERVQVRRKLAEYTLKSSESRKRPAGGTPETATRDTPNASPQSKDEDYTNPLKKKQRVSLYQKTSPSRPRSVSPRETTGMLSLSSTVAPAIISGKIVQLKEEEAPSFDRNSSPKNKEDVQRPGSANGRNKLSPKTRHDLPPRLSPKKPDPRSELSPSKITPKPVQSTGRPDQNRRSDDSKSQSNLSRTNDSFATFEQQDPMLDTSRSGGDNSQDEFLNKYKEIEGTDQRNKYKQDFSAEFKEYQRLYTKVAAEARRFAKWRMQYRKQEKGTEQYKSLARKVVHEYQILKENEEFVKDRSRLQYLHRKLKHIKELVLEFDCRQHEIERSRTAQREKRSRLPASDEDDDGGPRRSHAHRRSADLLRKQPVLSV